MRLADDMLNIVTDNQGLLNTNDALEGSVQTLAMFDNGFESIADFDYAS